MGLGLVYQVGASLSDLFSKAVVAFKASLKFVLFQLNRLGCDYFAVLKVTPSCADCPLYRFGKQFAELRELVQIKGLKC